MIRELFFARTDVFPVQQDDGTYRPVRRELTDEDIRRHLRGEVTLGTYTTSPDNKVKFICFDFDGDGCREHARRVHDYLVSKPPYRRSVLLELDTGGRGSHTWLLLRPTDARVAYHLGRRIAASLGLECEVFPKQPSIGPGGLGNLVKLPFGVHRKYGRWGLRDLSVLRALEPAEIPPDVAEAILNMGGERDISQDFIPWAGCQAMHAIGQGVTEGERNEACFLRCRVMFMAGLTRREAEAALRAWNERNRPPMQERELLAVVDSVYRKRKYTVGSWSVRKHPILGKYCEGCVNPVCERYARKRKRSAPKFRTVRLI